MIKLKVDLDVTKVNALVTTNRYKWYKFIIFFY